MLSDWQIQLEARAAVIGNGRVDRFGSHAARLQRVREDAILCDLSHYGVIAAGGSDAAAFLQAQLTNDVRELTPNRAQLSGYCSPKGRLLAICLLSRHDDEFFLELPGELLAAVRKRLNMYVLRSKVTLQDASERWVRIGLGGTGAASALEAILGAVPQSAFEMARHAEGSVIRLPGDRFEILVRPSSAADLWDRLAAHATPAGALGWEWLGIRAGIPTITHATQDQFVPQMVNFELIGGVNFQKGCYPGQEIVARTHYLGRIKRRMFLANIAAPLAPQPGDELYSPDLAGQASGMIVNAAPAPDSGFDALAVISVESARTQPIHFKSLDGPALTLLPLPYAVERMPA